jgi:hypothetical protein
VRTIVKKQKELNNMFLYTFIMNYLGGVYILQVNATDEYCAMRQWLEQLDLNEIQGFEEHHRQRLLKEDFIEENPTLIKGCKNVWCFGLKIAMRKDSAIINFVKTRRK